MNLISHWPWWRHLQREKSPEPDAADMGTAFGLDASFDAADPVQAERPAVPVQGRVSSRTGLPPPD